MDPDLIVVGGGAAGISAAREARRLGATPLIVEQGPVGGDCTFTGCVPSKALLSAAGRGATFSAAMAEVSAAVAAVAATEDDRALAREGIAVRHGRAVFVSPGEIDVEGTRLRARGFVVATGASPALPPVEGLDAAGPLTSDDVFDLRVCPERLGVLGGGPTGCELAQAFARLGSRVTVVEAERRLLPGEDPDASAVVAEALASDGVAVRTGASLDRVEGAGATTLLHLDDGTRIEVDRLLVAVGRRPATSGMGLDVAGVDTDAGGFVVTDDSMATSAAGVWAAGDVTGRLMLTHAAAAMARVAAANALAGRAGLRRRRFDASLVPRVTFTSPEVASVGLDEAQAAARHGARARVAFLPFAEVDRAVAAAETSGFVKLLAGPRRVLGDAGGGRLLGATIVGARAGELVHEVALAMRTRMFTGRLAQTVHAYPTWSVAVQLAAAQFFGEVSGRTARPARGGSPGAAR